MPLSERSSQGEDVSWLACAVLAEVWAMATAAACWYLHYFPHIPSHTLSWSKHFDIPVCCLKATPSWHSWGGGCVWPALAAEHSPAQAWRGFHPCTPAFLLVCWDKGTLLVQNWFRAQHGLKINPPKSLISAWYVTGVSLLRRTLWKK